MHSTQHFQAVRNNTSARYLLTTALAIIANGSMHRACSNLSSTSHANAFLQIQPQRNITHIFHCMSNMTWKKNFYTLRAPLRNTIIKTLWPLHYALVSRGTSWLCSSYIVMTTPINTVILEEGLWIYHGRIFYNHHYNQHIWTYTEFMTPRKITKTRKICCKYNPWHNLLTRYYSCTIHTKGLYIPDCL